MKKELVHLLETMNKPHLINNFLNSITLEDRETVSHLMSFVSLETKIKWEKHL